MENIPNPQGPFDYLKKDFNLIYSTVKPVNKHDRD